MRAVASERPWQHSFFSFAPFYYYYYYYYFHFFCFIQRKLHYISILSFVPLSFSVVLYLGYLSISSSIACFSSKIHLTLKKKVVASSKENYLTFFRKLMSRIFLAKLGAICNLPIIYHVFTEENESFHPVQ